MNFSRICIPTIINNKKTVQSRFAIDLQVKRTINSIGKVKDHPKKERQLEMFESQLKCQDWNGCVQ